MKLKEYLIKEGKSILEFSRLTGIPSRRLYYYVKEEHSPGIKRASIIQKVTGGEVTLKDLIGDGKKRRVLC